jgi:GH15 family glucan-1,4-alpha-glucosidase
LIGPHGDIAFMCFPGWSDPAIFASMMGGRGYYQVVPDTPRYVWGGYYDDCEGLIWNSRWLTEDSIVESREALAFPGERDTAIIMRRLTAKLGKTPMVVRLEVFADFGRKKLPPMKREPDGSWSTAMGDIFLRWSGASEAKPEEDGLTLRFTLGQSAARDFVLEISRKRLDAPPPDAHRLWRQTESEWAKAVPSLTGSAGKRDAEHAYAILRSMTTSGGGMVAAATTSLPERAEAGRNYDYRYCWIRDQAYAGLGAAGLEGSVFDDAVRFVVERVLDEGPELRPAYTPEGRRLPDQSEMGGLAGYPGADGVKVGNKAGKQFQLDCFGEALQLFARAAQQDRLSLEGWRAAQVAAESIEKRWEEPDSGVWELNPRWWAHSRLSCVAGLRQIARSGAHAPEQRHFEDLAERIAATTAAKCLHPSGRWQRAEDDPKLDAALLLPIAREAIPARDSRTVATVQAIVTELTKDGYVFRFRPDRDPLGAAEGAFLLCNFWMSLAVLRQGDATQAARWFERGRSACGPPGVYSEEYDVRQRQLRGNVPQAFVHAAVLECARELGAAGVVFGEETRSESEAGAA